MGYFVSSSSSSSSPSTSSESLFAEDLEAGISGCAAPLAALCPPPPPLAMARRAIAPENLYRRSGDLLGARPLPSPAATARLFFCDGLDDDEPRHFLHSCFRCKKSLSGNCDIFMYRGDTPFCSEECRQEQIEIDEERESERKHRLKASSRKDGKAKSGGGGAAASTSPKSSNRYQVRATGTVVAG